MPPPWPPSPPSGPPLGTNFSRLKWATPSPPLPAWTSILASSMNFMVGLAQQIKKPYRVDRAFLGACRGSGRHHAYRFLAHWAFDPEQYFARNLGVQGVVLAHADVLARMHLGAALAHDDAAGGDQLVAVALHAQALGLRIAAVSGAAACFLMCHILPCLLYTSDAADDLLCVDLGGRRII